MRAGFLWATCSKNLSRAPFAFRCQFASKYICQTAWFCPFLFNIYYVYDVRTVCVCYSNAMFECHNHLNDPNSVCVCVCWLLLSYSFCNRLIWFALHFMRHFIWPIFDLSIYGRSIYMAENVWICANALWWRWLLLVLLLLLSVIKSFLLCEKLWIKRWFFRIHAHAHTHTSNSPRTLTLASTPHFILASFRFRFLIKSHTTTNKKTLFSSFPSDLL